MTKLIGVKDKEREREREERGLLREVRWERFARREKFARGMPGGRCAVRDWREVRHCVLLRFSKSGVKNFDSKYLHTKNTFKTILGRSEAEINHFLCFDHFLSFWPYDNQFSVVSVVYLSLSVYNNYK